MFHIYFRTSELTSKSSQSSDHAKPPQLPKSARKRSDKSKHPGDGADLNIEAELATRSKSSKNRSQISKQQEESNERLSSAMSKGPVQETGSRVSSAKQRPKSSRPASRTKTSQSRPGSRAQSRASSRLKGYDTFKIVLYCVKILIFFKV